MPSAFFLGLCLSLATGAQSGEGAMNYAHDTPLYVQDMADWLDDDSRVHPCNFESAYKDLEIAAFEQHLAGAFDGDSAAHLLVEEP